MVTMNVLLARSATGSRCRVCRSPLYVGRWSWADTGRRHVPLCDGCARDLPTLVGKVQRRARVAAAVARVAEAKAHPIGLRERADAARAKVDAALAETLAGRVRLARRRIYGSSRR